MSFLVIWMLKVDKVSKEFDVLCKSLEQISLYIFSARKIGDCYSDLLSFRNISPFFWKDIPKLLFGLHFVPCSLKMIPHCFTELWAPTGPQCGLSKLLLHWQDLCHAEERRCCRAEAFHMVDKIWWCFSAFMVPSIMANSSTPLTQTCFTDRL